MYSYVTSGTFAEFGGEIMGQSVHDLDWESRGGAHRVAPEVASVVKAQAEAYYNMHCLVLR
jgi:hypothetical protein